MDTVLNLGLNDKSVEGLAALSDNRRFAFDSYRRFIQMFGNVVIGIEHDKFEKILDQEKEGKGVESDLDLTSDDLEEIVRTSLEWEKKLYEQSK